MKLFLKRSLILVVLQLYLASTAAAVSALRFPCEPELSPFLAAGEHMITKEIDLHQWWRMQIDDWGNEEMLVESGSLIVLDDQFMIVNLRFSKNFDYETNDMHLPERIMLVNHDLSIVNDNDRPEWRVMMYPDKDDPYSFHYIGTWNQTMYCIHFFGDYTNQQGERMESFHLHVDL